MDFPVFLKQGESRMNITNYADLLKAARQQPEPQRLLFVFTKPELPDGYTEAQQRDFEAGTGGVLTPQMCVDKALDELGDFSDLVKESRSPGIWHSIRTGI